MEDQGNVVHKIETEPPGTIDYVDESANSSIGGSVKGAKTSDITDKSEAIAVDSSSSDEESSTSSRSSKLNSSSESSDDSGDEDVKRNPKPLTQKIEIMGGFLEVQSPGKNSNKSPVKKKAEKKSPNKAKNRGEGKDDDHEANLTQMSKAEEKLAKVNEKIIKEKEAPTTDPAEKSSANKAQEEVKPAKQRKRITPPDNNETIVKHEPASSSKPTEHTPERSSRPRS